LPENFARRPRLTPAIARLGKKLYHAASRVFVSETERNRPFEVRVRLTRLLFGRASNLLMVGAAGFLSGVYAQTRRHEHVALAAACVGLVMILIRCTLIWAFKRRLALGQYFDPDTWTLAYGATAFASSACWGMVSFICLAFSHDPVLYLVSIICNTATAGSLAARNAASPRLARLQLCAGLLPIIPGALLADDPGYRFLVFGIPALVFGLSVVIDEINFQLVELYASQVQLFRLSNTDFLTQIPNRRYFGECCTDTEAARKTSLRPFTILMIDVDFFKGFNDYYGHPAGDACLQQIAALLQASLRNTDSVVSRYGGEEFAVLLRDTSEPAGTQIAQRLCEAVEDAALPHANRADGAPYVTISVGLGVAEGDRLDIGYEEVIKVADLALYRAKTQGRNRVCAALAA